MKLREMGKSFRRKIDSEIEERTKQEKDLIRGIKDVQKSMKGMFSRKMEQLDADFSHHYHSLEQIFTLLV